jgi:hypothetical protein
VRQRPENLIAAALRYGLRAAVSMEVAANDLARMAHGDRHLIEQAIGRIGWGPTHQPGPVAAYARRALELALVLTPERAATAERIPVSV